MAEHYFQFACVTHSPEKNKHKNVFAPLFGSLFYEIINLTEATTKVYVCGVENKKTRDTHTSEELLH